MNNTVHNVELIRFLDQRGYKQKYIQLITKLNQSYINKIIHSKLHKDTNDDNFILTEEEKIRINTLNTLIDPIPLNTDDNSQEIIYLHVLKFFMIEKEIIYKCYPYWTKTRCNRMLMKKDINILDFNATLLGLKQEDYLDLIIDYFV